MYMIKYIVKKFCRLWIVNYWILCMVVKGWLFIFSCLLLKCFWICVKMFYYKYLYWIFSYLMCYLGELKIIVVGNGL